MSSDINKNKNLSGAFEPPSIGLSMSHPIPPSFSAGMVQPEPSQLSCSAPFDVSSIIKDPDKAKSLLATSEKLTLSKTDIASAKLLCRP